MNELKKHHLKSNFSQIPNALILDPILKPGALKVVLYLYTKPEGWKVNNADIKRQCRIKRSETMAEYWRQILESGWITRELKMPGDIFSGYNYELHLSPTTKKPYTVENKISNGVRKDGVRKDGVLKNRTYNNTELSNTELSNINNNKRERAEKSTPDEATKKEPKNNHAKSQNQKEKEVPPKKEKSLAWTSNWLDKFAELRKEHGAEFSGFEPKDFKALVRIKSKFKNVKIQKQGAGAEISEPEYLALFEWLVRKAVTVDDFLKANPSPSILAGQFDKIVNHKSRKQREDEKFNTEFETYFAN